LSRIGQPTTGHEPAFQFCGLQTDSHLTGQYLVSGLGFIKLANVRGLAGIGTGSERTLIFLIAAIHITIGTKWACISLNKIGNLSGIGLLFTYLM